MYPITRPQIVTQMDSYNAVSHVVQHILSNRQIVLWAGIIGHVFHDLTEQFSALAMTMRVCKSITLKTQYSHFLNLASCSSRPIVIDS
jgi:hypothetical protein